MNDQSFVTLTKLAATFGVSRDAIDAWLADIGLRTGSGKPTAKVLKEGWCKILPGMVLWHRQRTIAALRVVGHSTANEQHAKDALTAMIANARSVLGWGEIQVILIAAKANEHGAEARII